jgi:hypothetical protein
MEVLKIDGTCEKCEDFTRPQDGGKVCRSNVCTETQKLLPDGTCSDCKLYTRGKFTERVSTTEYPIECSADKCEESEVNIEDGTC